MSHKLRLSTDLHLNTVPTLLQTIDFSNEIWSGTPFNDPYLRANTMEDAVMIGINQLAEYYEELNIMGLDDDEQKEFHQKFIAHVALHHLGLPVLGMDNHPSYRNEIQEAYQVFERAVMLPNEFNPITLYFIPNKKPCKHLEQVMSGAEREVSKDEIIESIGDHHQGIIINNLDELRKRMSTSAKTHINKLAKPKKYSPGLHIQAYTEAFVLVPLFGSRVFNRTSEDIDTLKKEYHTITKKNLPRLIVSMPLLYYS